MVGDRYFTDVLYGNRHGMLTVRPAPFAPAGDARAVRAARALEDRLVRRWRARGLAAPPHALMQGPDATFVL
jgi:phosphatidylglycerophosphatase GEP4